jgi:GntR family transcriptional repressor for pyruvate dehydrogenase complex
MIVDELIDQIRSGKMRVGEKLPNERALAESIGVSRMPLREAIHALGQVGILETRHGEGTFVGSYDSEKLGKTLYWFSLLDKASVYELLETRKVLEAEAAKMACRNATKDDLENIRKAMVEREELVGENGKKNDPESLARRFDADRRFHEAIAAASHNSIFSNFLKAIHSSLRLHQQTASKYRDTPQETSRIHREVYAAIVARDEEKAETKMREHLDFVMRAIQKSRGE